MWRSRANAASSFFPPRRRPDADRRSLRRRRRRRRRCWRLRSILENYLTCAGTKIENLLTIKFYIVDESIDNVADAFIIWWFLRGDFPEEEEDLTLLLPTVHFVAVPGVFPGVDFDGLPFDFAVMVEAVAAV